MRLSISLLAGASLLCMAWLGLSAPADRSSHLHCNDRFRYCLDYPASMFPSTYFSPDEDSLLFFTADSAGLFSVISTASAQKQDSHLAFEQRLRAMAAPSGTPNILSIINGDDYYEVSFLYGGHWYRQKAGFFQQHDVLFTIQVPVNRPELMVRMKEDVGIEF